MPASDEDYEDNEGDVDDYEPSDDCSHCACWGDGGGCCDCGAEQDGNDWSEEDDDPTPTSPGFTFTDSFPDDGLDEEKD